MPSRIIRDGWVDSEAIDSLTAEAERFFLRLCLRADDWGRFHGDPRLLRSALYPLRDNVSTGEIESWLTECQRATNGTGEPLVVGYQAQGKRYVLIPKHGQRRRGDMRPKFPDPPPAAADASQSAADYRRPAAEPPRPAAVCREPAASGEGEGEGEGEGDSRNPKAKAKACPEPQDHRPPREPAPSPSGQSRARTEQDARITEAIAAVRINDYPDIAAATDLAAVASVLTGERQPRQYATWAKRAREIGPSAFKSALLELFGEIKAGECDSPGAILNLKIARAKGGTAR